jgi:hypothetical protein
MVHDLLDAKGKQATRDLIDGGRGPRIVEAASWSADEDLGTGYIYSGWCPDRAAASTPIRQHRDLEIRNR